MWEILMWEILVIKCDNTYQNENTKCNYCPVVHFSRAHENCFLCTEQFHPCSFQLYSVTIFLLCAEIKWVPFWNILHNTFKHLRCKSGVNMSNGYFRNRWLKKHTFNSLVLVCQIRHNNYQHHIYNLPYMCLFMLTLYVLNFSEGTWTYIFIFCHSSTLI